MRRRNPQPTCNTQVLEDEAASQDTDIPGVTLNQLQSVTTNVGGTSIRHETLEGRRYMVVPMVMITEGVHNGSQGALYYPQDELAKTPVVWNHKPIVVYHPTMNGQAVSACEPAVLARRKVGLIMNTKYEPSKKGQPGRLKAEAWLETNSLKRVDNRVLEAVTNGEMMEVSTGLFTDNEVKDGLWHKESYGFIARNYRPDHLAILPDEKGACSIKDGAGLMRNAEVSHDEIRTQLNQLIGAANKSGKQPSGDYISGAWVQDIYGTFCVYSYNGKYYQQKFTLADGVVNLSGSPVEVRRKQTYMKTDGTVVNTRNGEVPMKTKQKKLIVDGLIANNRSRYEEDDREYLMGLDDGVLQDLQVANQLQGDLATDGKHDDASKEIHDTVKPKKSDTGGARGGEGHGGNDLKSGQQQTAKEDEDDEEDASDEGNTPNGKGVRNSARARRGNQTVDEYIANAPAGMRDVLSSMAKAHNSQKQGLIQRITANKANRFTPEYLGTKDLEELQAIAALANNSAEVQSPRISRFTGAGLDVSGEQQEMVDNEAGEEEPLVTPTLNFQRAKSNGGQD